MKANTNAPGLAHAGRIQAYVAGIDTWLPAMLLVLVASYLIYTANFFGPGYGRQRGMALFALVGLLVWTYRYWRPRDPTRLGVWIAATLVVALVLLNMLILARAWNAPHFTDIGTSTLYSIEAFWNHGQNPYAINVDEVWVSHPTLFLKGYKYFPLMLIVYSPLVSAFGPHGILLTNAFFYFATLGLVYLVSRHFQNERKSNHPVFALLVCLSVNTLATQSFVAGANDLVPVSLMLASYLSLLKGREDLAAIAIGAALAAKWFPSGLFFLVLLPWITNRWRFVILAGGTGAIFVIPFLAWNSLDFVSNAVIYQFLYPGDTTGFTHIDGPVHSVPEWRRALAPLVRTSVLAVLAALLLSYLWLSTRSAKREDSRPVLVGYSILCVFFLLAAKSNHTNYLLWIIPFIAPALHLVGPTSREVELPGS